MNGPHWSCPCGDEAPTATGDEAIAGAACHFLKYGSPHCYRSVRAYGAAGLLEDVSDHSQAADLRERYLSSFRAEACTRDEGPWGWCKCGCRDYDGNLIPGA